MTVLTQDRLKRYNLSLPVELYEGLEVLADEKHTTMLELIRKFIKLGLLVSEVEKDPEAMFLIRQGDSEREVVML